MTRTRINVLAGLAVLAAAGLGAGVAVAASGSSGQPAAATASPAPAAHASQGYSWYRSINADSDAAHGLVITAGGAATWMPMMTARPAFTGSALWFLGNPPPAGVHAGTLSFTATTPGTYRYLCPVPGHARDGMTGTFTVG